MSKTAFEPHKPFFGEVHGTLLAKIVELKTGCEKRTEIESQSSKFVASCDAVQFGNDTIMGQDGFDKLFGGCGDDVFHGTTEGLADSDGSETHGGKGNDWIVGLGRENPISVSFRAAS